MGLLRQRFREERLGLTAGSLTFTTLIALVPLLAVMLAVFTAFPMFAKFQDGLQRYLLQALVPEAIAKPVMQSLTLFASKANRVGSAGLVVLVASALSLLLTIDRALNAIWRVPKPRPMAQRVLVYWSLATLGPLLLGFSLSMTSYAISASRGLVDSLPGGVGLLLDLLEFLMQAAATAALFHYVPNTHVQWRHAFAGGLFVALGLELGKKGLGWYVAGVASYSAIYGAFATLPILLLWMYLSWMIVLAGAVLASYLPGLRLHVRRLPATPGLPFSLALGVLGELARVRGEGGGLAVEGLALRMGVDPLPLEPVLESLVAQGWVGRLDEAGSPRHVMLCDPARVAASAVVGALLLAPDARVAVFQRRTGLEGLTLADLLPTAPPPQAPSTLRIA